MAGQKSKKQTRHPSALKRNRQTIKRTARNRTVASTVRTYVKKVRAAIAAKDTKAAEEALLAAVSVLDKAAGKGVVHRKAAARSISRLSSAVNKTKTPAAAK